jgi:hypothetical protein
LIASEMAIGAKLIANLEILKKEMATNAVWASK